MVNMFCYNYKMELLCIGALGGSSYETDMGSNTMY